MTASEALLPAAVSPELREVLDVVRGFVDSEIIPVETAMLESSFSAVLPQLAELRKKSQEMGLFNPYLSKEAGGPGFTLMEYAMMSEQLGRSLLGHYSFNAQAPDVGNVELLHGYANERLKARWLAPLMAGEIRSAFSMTEPGHAGSNPTWLSTTAERDGAEYVINGDKWFTTAADGAAFTIVMAITNPDAESRHRRASMILVPTDTPGFSVVRNTPVMGEPGEDWASHGEVAFVDCRVPADNLIGEEGAGFVLAQERLGPGRIHHTMRWIGICERAIELMARHAIDREIAPGRALASRQVIQHWIADSRAETNAARLLVLDAAGKVQSLGNKGARTEISAIKFFVANTLQRVLDRALQAHGALGITEYTPISYWYRHERAARIYDGTDETHRNVVARTELAKYGYRMEF